MNNIYLKRKMTEEREIAKGERERKSKGKQAGGRANDVRLKCNHLHCQYNSDAQKNARHHYVVAHLPTVYTCKQQINILQNKYFA